MNSRVNLDNKSAVVLHYYPYRDSSLIVHFFLQDYGQVSAVAKGVKGAKGKQSYNRSSMLQPFQKLTVSLTGRQELLVLKSVELDHETTVNRWAVSGKGLYCAYYLNELLLRLLPVHTDCSDIFQLYEQIIHNLSQYSQLTQQSSIQYEMPLRMFELKLLEYLGYGLNLSYDIDTSLPVETALQYFYRMPSGPVQKPQQGEKYLQISGKTLTDLSKGQLTDEKTLQESKQLLKWALAEQLGDKPLKSRAMFRQLYGS